MVHRRVYEAVGGYDAALPAGQRLRLLAARRPAVPLPPLRRRAAGGDPPARREHLGRVRAARSELADVERALECGDGALRPARARAGARLGRARAAATASARRCCASPTRSSIGCCPVPGSPRSCAGARARSPRRSPAAALRPATARLMMTAFGWNDSGGGTTVPRLAAKELARRGWEVTVFHAAVTPTPSRQPYEVREWDEDGVHLIGVHNRPTACSTSAIPPASSTIPPITAGVRASAGPDASRRRPFPQPPQPRRVADRPGRGARPTGLLHDAQLLADVPTRCTC